MKNKIFIFFLSVFIIIIDQLAKFFAVKNLKSSNDFSFIKGLLDFTYVENEGMAFGLLKNSRWIFIIFTFLIIFFIIYLVIKKNVKNQIVKISFGFLLGGAISNLIDRIFLGYVIDYLKLSFFSPVCNFADYCICVGGFLLTYYLLFFYKKEINFS